MRKSLKLIAVMASLAVLGSAPAGISANQIMKTKVGTTVTPRVGVKVNSIKIEKLKEAVIPKELKNLVAKYKGQRGAVYIKKDAYYYFAVMSGTKATGGYGIDVTSALGVNASTNITVKETEPKKGAITNQMITYPIVYFRVTNIVPYIHINNDKGISLPILSPSTLNYPKPVQQPMIKVVPFDVVGEKNIPSELLASTHDRGFNFTESDGIWYVAIYAGEKPTAGFGFTVLSVENKQGIKIITVKENTPPSGDMVAEVLSYPMITISMKDIGQPDFIVKTDKGEELTPFKLRK